MGTTIITTDSVPHAPHQGKPVSRSARFPEKPWVVEDRIEIRRI
jgi:hypothetical protein